MSALGQKQTFAVQNGMSALPPKADMCSALGDVRFVPIADIEGLPGKVVDFRQTRQYGQDNPDLSELTRLRSSSRSGRCPSSMSAIALHTTCRAFSMPLRFPRRRRIPDQYPEACL